MAIRFFKFDVGRDEEKDGNTVRFVRPSWYDSARVKVVAMEHGKGHDKVRARGDKKEEWVISTTEEDYAEKIKKQDGVTELTVDETKKIGDDFHARVEPIVTRQNKVSIVLARAALGKKLSKKDRAILDENDPTPGINMPPKKSEEIEGMIKKYGR